VVEKASVKVLRAMLWLLACLLAMLWRDGLLGGSLTCCRPLSRAGKKGKLPWWGQSGWATAARFVTTSDVKKAEETRKEAEAKNAEGKKAADAATKSGSSTAAGTTAAGRAADVDTAGAAGRKGAAGGTVGAAGATAASTTAKNAAKTG
jgi:hypothetical protein